MTKENLPQEINSDVVFYAREMTRPQPHHSIGCSRCEEFAASTAESIFWWIFAALMAVAATLVISLS